MKYDYVVSRTTGRYYTYRCSYNISFFFFLSIIMYSTVARHVYFTIIVYRRYSRGVGRTTALLSQRERPGRPGENSEQLTVKTTAVGNGVCKARPGRGSRTLRYPRNYSFYLYVIFFHFFFLSFFLSFPYKETDTYTVRVHYEYSVSTPSGVY